MFTTMLGLLNTTISGLLVYTETIWLTLGLSFLAFVTCTIVIRFFLRGFVSPFFR